MKTGFLEVWSLLMEEKKGVKKLYIGGKELQNPTFVI
jgi:hypothetical protein